MRALSLHILDLVENSIRAQATTIVIRIVADPAADLLRIEIEDDGTGLKVTPEQALDPFYTTKGGKRTGLGLSLFRAAAEAAGGGLTLGLTVLTTGLESLRAYLAFSGEIARLMHVDGFDVWKQHSWRGFFALLGGEGRPSAWMTAASIATCLASLAVLLRLWRGPWRPGSPAFALRLSALIMATLLTSPHLFHYDMVLAVLPVALWAAAGEVRHRSAFVAIVALGFAWLALGGAAGATLRVQLSPLLMAGWLLLAERAVREPSDGATTAEHGHPDAVAVSPP